MCCRDVLRRSVGGKRFREELEHSFCKEVWRRALSRSDGGEHGREVLENSYCIVK